MINGIDVSSWQDNNNTPQKPDLQKLKDNGVKFVFVRAYNGAEQDEDFAYYWGEAKRLNLLRGAYAFHEYRNGIAKITRQQAIDFWEIIKNDPGEIPPVIDYEQPNSNWPPLPDRTTGLTNLEIWFNYIDTAYGKKAILYTNPNTLKYNLRPRSDSGGWLWQHPLWVAQYLYRVDDKGALIQPLQQSTTIADLRSRVPYYDGWPTFKFWQFTDRMDGKKFGMESAQLDGDVYNGSLEDLCSWSGYNTTHTPMPTFEEHMVLYHGWKNER